MTKRINKMRKLLDARTGKPEWSELDVMIGHPCGSIAYSMWLAKNPKKSVMVSNFLLSDAGPDDWNKWSFASEIKLMMENGCKVSRGARRLVKWWDNKGNPKPWAADENRCYLLLDGEFFLNCPYEDMRWFKEAHEQTGGTAEYHTPNKELRAKIQAQPLYIAGQSSEDVPF